VLAVILATGCYWGDQWSSQIWTRAINIAGQGAFDSALASRSLNFVRYPILFLLYAAGLAAIAARRFDNLFAVLVQPQQRRENRTQSITLGLEVNDIFNGDEKLPKALRANPREYDPVSNHLFERIRPLLSDLHLTSDEFEESFVRFEYFRSLVHMDLYKKTFGSPSIEPGRFVRQWKPLPKPVESVFDEEIARDGDSWPPLKAGFFDNSLSQLGEMKKAHDEHLQKLRASRW